MVAREKLEARSVDYLSIPGWRWTAGSNGGPQHKAEVRNAEEDKRRESAYRS